MRNTYPETFYLGEFRKCLCGYALDERVRERASSGGMATAFLTYLLDRKLVDGALVSRVVTNGGKVGVESFVARSREEVLSAQSSIYMDFPLMDKIRSLRPQDGRFAVVALPCHLRKLEKLQEKDSVLKDRIPFKLGLFCCHVSTKSLLLKALRLKDIREEDVQNLTFRVGRWRGHTSIALRDGTTRVLPWSDYRLRQNLFFHCARRCLSCTDQFAEKSDVSFGDAWLRRMKSQSVNHSMIVARTRETEEILADMARDGYAHVEDVAPALAIKSQWRALVFHKFNIAARKEVGPYFGYKVGYDGPHKPRWNDYAGAFLYLLSMKLSESEKWGEMVFKLPKPLLYGYLLLSKLMINF